MELKEQKTMEPVTTLQQVKTVIANVKSQLSNIEELIVDAESCKSSIAKNTLTAAACKIVQKFANVI